MEIDYRKVTKHRKKCRECGKLIKDGERVKMIHVVTEKIYPVKGNMERAKWIFAHVDCVNAGLPSVFT